MATISDVRYCCGEHPIQWYFDDDGDDDTTCHQHQSPIGVHDNRYNDSGTCSTYEEHLDAKEQQRLKKEKKEALGWTLDAAARGAAVMGLAVFVSSELLRRARVAAGCNEDGMEGNSVEADDYEVCEKRVYGMKPSSLLTNLLTIVGLLSAFLMPLIGSVVDHTTYRRAVGRISGAAMTIFILLQMLLLEKAWFAAAIMQIFIAFTYTIHLCVVYAYLPELTKCSERLVHYTAQFTAAQYGSSVLFLIFMVVVLSVVPRHMLEVFSPVEISQSLLVVICSIFLGVAWTWLFRKRPASQHVPEGSTLLTAGMHKTLQTSKLILEHHSAIKWFLLSVVFTEAATYTFSTIAITYMTDQLNFTSRENGIAILLLLLFGVPGTRLAALTNHINPIRSLQMCLLLWIAATSMAALLLRDPGHQYLAYFFAMLWGVCLGWINPTEKTLYCTIIPRGQEAELMGTYICAGQVLSWLPSMVFSILNEAGFSMQLGLFSLTFYFATSFFLLFLVGDYEEAVAHAKMFGRPKPPVSDDRKHQADFVIISDYEEAVAHKRSFPSIEIDESEMSGDFMQC